MSSFHRFGPVIVRIVFGLVWLYFVVLFILLLRFSGFYEHHVYERPDVPTVQRFLSGGYVAWPRYHLSFFDSCDRGEKILQSSRFVVAMLVPSSCAVERWMRCLKQATELLRYCRDFRILLVEMPEEKQAATFSQQKISQYFQQDEKILVLPSPASGGSCAAQARNQYLAYTYRHLSDFDFLVVVDPRRCCLHRSLGLFHSLTVLASHAVFGVTCNSYTQTPLLDCRSCIPFWDPSARKSDHALFFQGDFDRVRKHSSSAFGGVGIYRISLLCASRVYWYPPEPPSHVVGAAANRSEHARFHAQFPSGLFFLNPEWTVLGV